MVGALFFFSFHLFFFSFFLLHDSFFPRDLFLSLSFPFFHAAAATALDVESLTEQLQYVFDGLQHQNFEGVSNHMLYNPLFRQALTHIHNMSSSLTVPLFLDPHDAHLTVEELMERDFVDSLTTATGSSSIDSTYTARQVCDIIKNAQIFTSEEIKLLVSHFEQRPSPEPEKIVRTYAFPSHAHFKSILADKTLLDPVKRLVNIPLTTDFFRDIISTYSTILEPNTSSVLHRFAYSFFKLQSKGEADNDAPLNDKERRLKELRASAAKLGLVYFTKKPKGISLQEYSEYETPIHRVVSQNYMKQIHRDVQKDKDDTVGNTPPPLTCYICPPLAREKTNTNTRPGASTSAHPLPSTSANASTREEDHDVVSKTNILRLIPFDTERMALMHLNKKHLGYLSSPLLTDKHTYFGACVRCANKCVLEPQNPAHVRDLFACCPR